MKKIILILSLSFISNLGFTQDCSGLKTIKLRVDDENFTTHIERVDGFQIEYTPSVGLKVKTKITWISECSYTLKTVKIIENKNNIELPEVFFSSITTCTIISRNSKYYIVESSTIINGKEENLKIKYVFVE